MNNETTEGRKLSQVETIVVTAMNDVQKIISGKESTLDKAAGASVALSVQTLLMLSVIAQQLSVLTEALTGKKQQ